MEIIFGVMIVASLALYAWIALTAARERLEAWDEHEWKKDYERKNGKGNRDQKVEQ